jgi:hypothetical protein
MARASRGDELLASLGASLPAAACAALGPLALLVLTLRFLRRHEVARLPHEAAVALLVCGVVAATLSARRQARSRRRLPARPPVASALASTPASPSLWQPLPHDLHRHAAPLKPAAVHAAALFLRCSSDLLSLNSACGAPLRLAGAWEWFDSVLFHKVYAAVTAAPQTSWLALFRGDQQLVDLAGQLRPLAFAEERATAGSTEGEVRAAAAAQIARAATVWQAVRL